MKRFALLSACLAVLSASTGCCCLAPLCGGYGGGCGYAPACAPAAPACSPCSPGGYGAMYAPTSAYAPGASFTAGLSIGPTYAAAPYPVVAAAPLDVLPTY
ncbi:MAG: hypothetical protein U0992_25095 [Planctomycetaceae bacterium]